jgi:hypothetical protein
MQLLPLGQNLEFQHFMTQGLTWEIARENVHYLLKVIDPSGLRVVVQ